jgi:glycosyltransferase involved in cell wall biosynthesis
MKIAVVIPSYRVRSKILAVIERIGPEVACVFVVDDKCPENSGKYVQENCKDPRVRVIFQEKNEGVGGATLRGFLAAEQEGCEIAVKLDGDGQMDARFIPVLVRPILEGKADYAKGNRFFSPRALQGMPKVRLLGNAGISFLAKITTGYWGTMDPTNGYVAIHTALLPLLDVEKISRRYFFENDLLFRLGLIRAAVVDVPMHALYADESSSLSVTHSLFVFPGKFAARFFKRVFYRYFLRDFSVGSVLLVASVFLMAIGVVFGAYHWEQSAKTGAFASSGTVMLAALPVLLGFQMLIFVLLYDILTVPRDPLHPYIAPMENRGAGILPHS